MSKHKYRLKVIARRSHEMVRNARTRGQLSTELTRGRGDRLAVERFFRDVVSKTADTLRSWFQEMEFLRRVIVKNSYVNNWVKPFAIITVICDGVGEIYYRIEVDYAGSDVIRLFYESGPTLEQCGHSNLLWSGSQDELYDLTNDFLLDHFLGEYERIVDARIKPPH